MNPFRACLLAGVAVTLGGVARAEFLYQPGEPTPNGLHTPTLSFEDIRFQYSAWDTFYSPHTHGNYPDIFAPFGGVEISEGIWAPVERSSVPGFPAAPGIYNPGNPLAFWDVRNATITQTGGTDVFIIGPDAAGNIYSFSQVNTYELANTVNYGTTGIGSVILQFQTDGSTVDFGNIRLVYDDGLGGEAFVYASEAEYLREYQSSGGGHWSATAGYSNRVAIQWDLSELRDVNGDPISSYKLRWEASSTSMSLQKVDLVTTDTYQAGIPISAAWVGGNGNWSSAANWQLKDNSGLTLPQANGNIRIQNINAATINLDQAFTLGELIFESGANVTINSSNGATLKSNTGIATRDSSSAVYTINTNFILGAVNFFDIGGGTVVMNGAVSGPYGIVKSGGGTLDLKNNNTFTGFLAVQSGTVRVAGNNTYSGTTSVVNGRIVVARNAGATGALGSATSSISVGADESLYHYSAAGQNLLGELFIEGDHTVSRNIALAPGDFSKRLGAMSTSATGATYAGAVSFTGSPTDPSSSLSAADRVFLTAQTAADRMTFSGNMTGGNPTALVTLDGQGTVAYSGPLKTYGNSTVVQRGKLLLAPGSGYSGAGNMTVKAGAELIVQGTLSGAGTLQIDGGTVSGAGQIQRPFELNTGDVLSPGLGIGVLRSVDQEWSGGGRLRLEITDAAGVSGDLLEVTGDLSLTAGSSNRFILSLQTVDANGNAALAANFNPANSYSWKFLTTTEGFVSFGVNDFAFDLAGFGNALSGDFSVARIGNDLYLNYVPVPEPGGAWLILAGALGMLACRPPRGSAQKCKAGRDE